MHGIVASGTSNPLIFASENDRLLLLRGVFWHPLPVVFGQVRSDRFLHCGHQQPGLLPALR
jgi:hypothetical protein